MRKLTLQSYVTWTHTCIQRLNCSTNYCIDTNHSDKTESSHCQLKFFTMADNRLRVGIIGAGEVAQVIHLPALAMLSHLYITTAVCDISEKVRTYQSILISNTTS